MIELINDGKVVIKVCDDGSVLLHGKEVGKDPNIIEPMRQWIQYANERTCKLFDNLRSENQKLEGRLEAAINNYDELAGKFETLKEALEKIKADKSKTILGPADNEITRSVQQAHELGANKAFVQAAEIAEEALGEECS